MATVLSWSTDPAPNLPSFCPLTTLPVPPSFFLSLFAWSWWRAQDVEFEALDLWDKTDHLRCKPTQQPPHCPVSVRDTVPSVRPSWMVRLSEGSPEPRGPVGDGCHPEERAPGWTTRQLDTPWPSGLSGSLGNDTAGHQWHDTRETHTVWLFCLLGLRGTYLHMHYLIYRYTLCAEISQPIVNSFEMWFLHYLDHDRMQNKIQLKIGSNKIFLWK